MFAQGYGKICSPACWVIRTVCSGLWEDMLARVLSYKECLLRVTVALTNADFFSQRVYKKEKCEDQVERNLLLTIDCGRESSLQFSKINLRVPLHTCCSLINVVNKYYNKSFLACYLLFVVQNFKGSSNTRNFFHL